MKHASHPDIVKRLKRAEGHLRSLITMFDGSKSCVELAQQLHAVESAIAGAKRELIHDHIEHCLNEGSSDANVALREFKALVKYL